jgi:signal transduction histidine kinase
MGARYLGQLLVVIDPAAAGRRVIRLTVAQTRYNGCMVKWSFDTHDERAARATRHDFARHVRSRYGTDVDAMAAEIVLGELISNAVRYAPGRTHVQAEFDERGVTIAVQDSGKGFIPRSVPALDGLLSESGRGLAIVSRLAERMEIKCRMDDGCCIRARLDVRRAS